MRAWTESERSEESSWQGPRTRRRQWLWKFFFRFYIVLFSCPIAFYFSTFSSISGFLLQRTACIRPTLATVKNEENQTLLKKKKIDNRRPSHIRTHVYTIYLSHINESICVRYVMPPPTNYSFPCAIKILTFFTIFEEKKSTVLYTVCTHYFMSVHIRRVIGWRYERVK